ncbi:Mrp/NBP35 family ATP-binding protein [Paenibacillus athensensis]|uniref:Iron-sulfur cluster carrier protein n=1 Tax=Paenibacillus athensensis TaxID=1967502 RepID=A0A4Y8PU61_9BACL|nr:Mrp/NBP35 family ATP-binding protein [Paenibacillus athensensis]MCD1261987.1 Mrp/NBP35 family ATP-binding protein [Paenibacillus athensensis]
MITKEELVKAVEPLIDPQYQRSVSQLNLVRDVMLKEDSVSLTFVATVDDEAYREDVRSRIEEALRAQGVEQTHIRFRMITDFERKQIEEALEGMARQQQAAPQAAPKASVLDPASGVQFIAIASGKGGVGKSTVTVNLAVALARLGKKVGIVDADIYGFSIPDMMGIEDRPQIVDNAIQPVERFGVKVISMGFFVQDNAPVIWRGPMLGKMLRNFFNEVNWGDIDYILLDLPPGTGDVALDVHQMIPQSKEIVVTTPHATAAFVAARAGAMAVQTNHEIVGIVENMAYYACKACGEKDYVFGRGGGAKLAEELNAELLAQLPLGAPDNHVSEPDYAPSVYKADSTTGKLYLELAEAVLKQIDV